VLSFHSLRQEMAREPVAGQSDHALERARFGKQMRGAGHDLQRLDAAQARERLFVECGDRVIEAADDQQRRRADRAQRGSREIRPAPRETIAATF